MHACIAMQMIRTNNEVAKDDKCIMSKKMAHRYQWSAFKYNPKIYCFSGFATFSLQSPLAIISVLESISGTFQHAFLFEKIGHSEIAYMITVLKALVPAPPWSFFGHTAILSTQYPGVDVSRSEKSFTLHTYGKLKS